MKNVIYFPSLSSFAPYLKKDIPLINDYSHRFYDKKFGKFTHPYFLLSAGSVYKRKKIREELEMKDILVFGDSGGFQIATGALKWDVSLRDDIFNWLVGNSDIAMNIDIPPVSKNYTLQQCIDITVDNMQYFEKRIEDEKVTNTDFLNVIQCETIPCMLQWFEAVKGFTKFKGWGAGNVASTQNYVHLIKMFLEHDVYSDPNFKWFHFLGKTTPLHYILYAVLQKKLNEYYPHIQVTTDSSTPAMQAVFGNWYHSVNYRNMSFAKLYYGNKGRTDYIQGAPLPCGIDCPMCKEITFTNVENDGGKARFYIAYHNLFLMNKALDDINIIAQGHLQIFESLVPADFYKVIKTISDLFDKMDEVKNPGKTRKERVLEMNKYFEEQVEFLKRFDVKSKKEADKEGVEDGDIFGLDEEESKLTAQQKAEAAKIEQGIILEEDEL